jgi:hypothetical protein
MNRIMLLGGLACLLWNTHAAASDVTLTDVHYSVHSGYSRVTLTFDGEVRYSQLAADGSVRLGFSRTGVAIPMKARRQAVNAGLVSSISVTPLPDDSAVVAIALRGSTTYRCILPATGNALYVDVLPAGTGSAEQPPARIVNRRTVAAKTSGAAIMTAIAHAPAQKERAKAATSKPRSVTEAPMMSSRAPGVVDIPTLAREQLQTGHVAVVAPTTVQLTPVQGLSPAAALGISVIVGLLMIGSGVALSFVIRRTSPAPVQAPLSVQPEAPIRRFAETELDSPRSELLVDDPDEDDESRFAHETSLQLARTFRRGSEEITLARRLHDHAAPQLSAARMEETLNRATTANQRLHFARKLGVGRGEMDLAAKLRTIRPAEKKEGVVS